MVHHTDVSVVTIERFIIEQEKRHAPQATGELSGILYDLALAAKMIANKVRSAGLADILGCDREHQRAWRDPAEARRHGQRHHRQGDGPRRASLRDGVGGGTRHHSDPGRLPDREVLPAVRSTGWVSNIDVNVPVGTIFSVLKKVSPGPRGELSDMLQLGRRQVAAGYVIYGSSTMLVYTTGQGVHGFTLDPSIGEFLLSHPDIRTPRRGRYLSVNDSYARRLGRCRCGGSCGSTADSRAGASR